MTNDKNQPEDVIFESIDDNSKKNSSLPLPLNSIENDDKRITSMSANPSNLPSCSFEQHLHYPEPIKKSNKRQVEKLPSAISSQEWRTYYNRKENIKNRKEEINKKRKEEKLKAKDNKELSKKKKRTEKSIKKGKGKQSDSQVLSPRSKENVKCSSCNEELISDTEDEADKNIGCDECPRWYHMKCTEFCGLPYSEAANKDYICFMCT